MLKIRTYWFAALLAAGTVLAGPAIAQQYGLVADDATNSVNVFDLGTSTVVSSIPIPLGSIGDVAITPDQTLGFATNFRFQVFVIDLTISPPGLAMGTNPIPISNSGEDLTVTADGQFLLVSDGSSFQPVSVVDIATQSEVSTFSTGRDNNSIDLCDDGTSVLVTSSSARVVRRLTLDPITGILTDTGEVLSLGLGAVPNNVHCAPGSGSGVVVTRNEGAIRSFTIPGLPLVDTRTLADFGDSAVFGPAGDRVFVRSASFFATGLVEAFDYDAATGALGTMPSDSVAVADTTTFFGMDQLAINAAGDALYVPEGSPVFAVSIRDAANLTALLGSITDPNIVQPTGIALGSEGVLEVAINIKPGGDPNSINLCSQGATTVTIFGNEVDVALIDPDSLVFASASVKTVSKSDRSLCSIEDAGAPDPMFFDNLDPTPDFIDDLTCHFLTEGLSDLDDISTSADVTGAGCDDPNDADGCQPGDAGFFEIIGTDSVNIVKDCL